MSLTIHENIVEKLNNFIENKKIPNLIFHGTTGSGKKTLLFNFLKEVYKNETNFMKNYVMIVNCAHGKGIKFIREELKFFARTNINLQDGNIFKSIILLNADKLTIDAQSALRRCIELFSHSTRFFIIVDDKYKLLKPILSRFCEVYVPETKIGGRIQNLHQYTTQNAFHLGNYLEKKREQLDEWMKSVSESCHKGLIDLVVLLYDSGYSCLDLVDWLKRSQMDAQLVSSAVLCFHKIKGEYRSEKMLMFYLLDYVFLRPNKDLKNVGFM